MSSGDLIFWRLTTAIFWSIAVQSLFFLALLFIINLNLWHPVLWIQHSISTCLSFGTWLYICPYAAVIVAQGLVCSRDYMIVKKYCGTRFSMICNMLSVHNLIMIGLHAVIGGVIAWIYLSLLGGKYSSIVAECSENKEVCLVEEYLFLLLNGFWIGLVFFIQSYFASTNTLCFPVVQQLKFLQVKTELQPLAKQALVSAVMPTLYFFLFYFWKGESIRNFVCGMIGYNIEDSGLAGLGLINISLLFYSWLSSTAFILTMNTLKLLFQVYLTESIVFPITTVFGNSDDCMPLRQALAMTDLPIIQYLGFLDLKNLAEKNRSRRDELFTLSQPGGHPYNWNAVVAECLKLVKTFTEDLNKANIDLQPSPETKTHSISTEYFPASYTATSPTILNTSGMRNLSLRLPVTPNISGLQTENVLLGQSMNVTGIQPQCGSVRQTLKLFITQNMNTLCKKPGISFLFGEIPDAKVRYHLAQAQPVIWAVQGLAYLSAASLKEDSYGVVQKDLPEIITAFLQLKQALDKLQKIGNYKKSHRTDYFELRMKSALRSAVKRSLYCICIEFGDYLKELKLTKDIFQQIQPYLLFREG